MKFASIASLLLASLLLGCGTPGVPLPPSLELPQPVQDLRATRKGDTVLLSWTVPGETTDRTNIRPRHLGPTLICRGLRVAMVHCADQVGQVDTAALAVAAEAAAEAKARSAAAGQKARSSKPAPLAAAAKDTLPHDLQAENPDGFVTYAVEIMNSRGRSAGLSNQVQVPLAPTLPPPFDLAAAVTANGVVLTWTGMMHEHELPELRHAYRIFRQEQGSATPELVGETSLSASPQGQLIDHSFVWQKTYRYWVTVVTLLARAGKPAIEVEGDNSPPITVFANDVFPPAAPAGLQAVFSGVGQQPFVDLTWASNTEPDLAGYNLYRREANGAWTRINSALVLTPAFRDSNVASGHAYFYAVTAVDTRGNESPRSEEAEETVPGSG